MAVSPSPIAWHFPPADVVIVEPVGRGSPPKALDPKGIKETADFARKNVTLVNRETGSGSRLLLDANLERLGIPTSKVNGYDQVAHGQLPAAWQASTGQADCLWRLELRPAYSAWFRSPD